MSKQISKKSGDKQQKRSSGQISQGQKKLLQEGRRGRKLSGRNYNVRDLKIDKAEKGLSETSSLPAKRGQKRKATTKQSGIKVEEDSNASDENEDEEEEEEEEGEEYESEEEEEEEGEEEEVEEEELSPSKRRKLAEEPRSEILKKLTKKEQEAVLRYYQQTGRLVEKKEDIEKYFKSRPENEKKSVNKFLNALHEAADIGKKVQQAKSSGKIKENKLFILTNKF